MDEQMKRWINVRQLAAKITLPPLLQFLACHMVGTKDTEQIRFSQLGAKDLKTYPVFYTSVQLYNPRSMDSVA